MTSTDSVFAGSIPGLYDRYMGPLLFLSYADEMARRAAEVSPQDIVETAAGTGLLTAALHALLPDANIVATDLNPAMLAVAAEHIRSDKVRFEAADALALPFDDASFDLVICQFGAMFFPDKVRANSEARRVLRDGGHYIAAIWDRLDRNPVSQIVHDTVTDLYPDDPPSFFARTPHGYADRQQIERDVRAAGFADVRIETVELESRPVSAADAAIGLVGGSPLRNEIEERNPDGVDSAIAAAAHALNRLDTNGRLDSRLSAHIVTATI
jgi:ubiquinone/menaquinone biosynthesis C-methylase UbiE